MPKLFRSLSMCVFLVLSTRVAARDSCTVLESIPPGEPKTQCFSYPCPPIYPPDAARKEQQGHVLLSLVVDATGKPLNVAVLEPSLYASLNEAAIQVAQRTTFPIFRLSKDSSPVCYKTQYPVDFSLPKIYFTQSSRPLTRRSGVMRQSLNGMSHRAMLSSWV